jgi:hypothetical protein
LKWPNPEGTSSRITIIKRHELQTFSLVFISGNSLQPYLQDHCYLILVLVYVKIII